MKNKKLLQLYYLFFITFCFPQSIIGMELVPAIVCSIEKNTEQNDAETIETIIEPSDEEKQNALELSACIAGENSIIYTAKDNNQMYHYVFSINDISKLFSNNDYKTEYYCKIKNNEEKIDTVKLIINNNDKKCFEEINNKQQNKNRRNRVKIEYTELSKTVNIYKLQIEETINTKQGPVEKTTQIDLELDSVKSLAQLISSVNFVNPNDVNETKNILFTFKEKPDQPSKVMSLPINNSTKNLFPILQQIQQPIQQDKQKDDKKDPIIQHILDSIETLRNSNKDDESYNTHSKTLQTYIINTISTIDPNYIKDLNINLNEPEPDIMAELQKKESLHKKFFLPMQCKIHPDKNQNDNTKQKIWNEIIEKINKDIINSKSYKQKICYEENKAFVSNIFLSHAFLYAANEVGTLAGTLAFAISDKKQKNEITQLKNKVTQLKNKMQNLQQKNKNDLLKTKNNLLKAKNKVNKYLKKPLTSDEFHKIGQSLERYL